MEKKNINTTRGGREHDEGAGHDVSEADVDDELGQMGGSEGGCKSRPRRGKVKTREWDKTVSARERSHEMRTQGAPCGPSPQTGSLGHPNAARCVSPQEYDIKSKIRSRAG